MSESTEWKLLAFEGGMAEAYELFFVPVLFGPWAHKLVNLAAPKAGERVLDLACGTGIVARAAAQSVSHLGKAAGVDTSPLMLDVAGRVSTGIVPPIEWREGSALAIPYPDASFDLVLCQAALMFFAEPKATREMFRVLAPGGRILLTVWRSIEYCLGQRALVEALERHVSKEAADWLRSPFSLGNPQEIRELLLAGGFSDIHLRLEVELTRVDSVESWVNIQASTTPLGEQVARLDERARESFLQEIRAATAAYADDDGLAMPQEAYVATAYKPAG